MLYKYYILYRRHAARPRLRLTHDGSTAGPRAGISASPAGAKPRAVSNSLARGNPSHARPVLPVSLPTINHSIKSYRTPDRSPPLVARHHHGSRRPTSLYRLPASLSRWRATASTYLSSCCLCFDTFRTHTPVLHPPLALWRPRACTDHIPLRG